MTKAVSETIAAGNSGSHGREPAGHDRIEKALLYLRKLSTLLHSTLDIELILEHVVRESILIAGADNGMVALCTAAGISRFLYFKKGRQVSSNHGWTPGAGVPGRVILKAESYLCNDTGNDPQIDPGLAAAYGVRNAVSTPILDSTGEMIGYLEIQNKLDPSGFTSFDLGQLTTVAQIAGQSIRNALAFQKIARDAVELEQKVAERTAQLQETNEELDSFAYSVSHDLRAPLRAIQAFAALLIENKDKPEDPERGDFLGRIIAAAEDMDQMILHLLDYSRLSRQELLSHTVSLDQVVAEAADQLEREGKGGGFRLEVAGPLPRVRGDHAVLVQVILNLLSNAVKYVAPGKIPELRIWAEQAEGTVRFVLQDNGIGIAPQDQQRIFKLFERLHGVESYNGAGVGLAIAQKAVVRLGGRIGVDSRLGEGSRFWIELPAGETGVIG